jgi:hypothetical protein
MSTREAIALAEAAAERARQEAAAGLIKLSKRRGDNSTMSGGKGYLRRGNTRRGNMRRGNMRRGNTRRGNMRRGTRKNRRGSRKNRRGSRRN